MKGKKDEKEPKLHTSRGWTWPVNCGWRVSKHTNGGENWGSKKQGKETHSVVRRNQNDEVMHGNLEEEKQRLEQRPQHPTDLFPNYHREKKKC